MFFGSINANNVFFIFGCWLMPENLAFTRKIMALSDMGAAALPAPMVRTSVKLQSRPSAVNETPSQIRDVTCHIWNHTVLAATRHK